MGGEIRDPIHGFINRNDLEEGVINTPVFQRLRRIRQLAFAYLVYPGAHHSRFEHSVGAMHVAGRIGDQVNLDPEQKRLVRLSALLHDVGHGPFSHVSEPVLEKFSALPPDPEHQIHERITTDIIKTDTDISYLLSERDREQIIDTLLGRASYSVIKGIVSGPLDADKQDYLLRDSYFCGVRYGVYDLERLAHALSVLDDANDRFLVLNEDGIHALEQFVLAKYYMTTQVYRHRVRLITDSMLRRGLELGIERDRIPWLETLFKYDGTPEYVKEYVGWTDDRLMNVILSGSTPDGYAKTLFRQLTERKLFKQAASYRVAEFADPLHRSTISSMLPPMRAAIEGAIGDYLKVDPNLVVLSDFSIKSVRQQARNSEASLLISTQAGGPKQFDEVSQLFRSIDEASQEMYLEVYAPFDYGPEGKAKRDMKEKHHEGIFSVIERELAGCEGGVAK